MKSIDLHGYRVEEVAEAVDAFLHQLNQSGANRGKIVTGKGTGKVQKEVIKYLKLGGYPWQYETLKNGNQNTGVIILLLD